MEALAAKGVDVLDAGLRSRQGELVRAYFARWSSIHGNSTLTRAIESLHLGPSYRLGIRSFQTHIYQVLSDENGAEAAVRLQELIDRFSEPRQPAQDTRPAPGDHVDFREATFHGTVVGVQNNAYAPPPGVALPDPGSWPTVAEADPVALGVRPVRRFEGDGGPLPYIRRDIEDGLRDWHARDGLLVITGGPLTGKSMTAWTAVLRRTAGDARVYAPAPGADLRGLPGLLRCRDGEYVLWLDELEGHLGEHGLSLGLLAELTALGVPVVATMNDEAYDEHRFGTGPASRLLSRARTETVSSRWSLEELKRLVGARHPRLTEALQRRGTTGVTQYLAADAELWALRRRAGRSNSRHPHGYLLVRAAMDLTCCGVTEGIPRQLLEEACRRYGSFPTAARRESFEEALAWAAEPRHGVTGLLVRGTPRRVGDSDETWQPYGSLVADALRHRPPARVRLDLWQCALEGTAYDTEVHRAVRVAAHAAFSDAAQDGDPDAMHMMGLLGADAGDEDAALEWFRMAVEAGKGELSGRVGRLLLERGRADQALPHLRAATEREPGGPEVRLLGQAHLALAEQCLRTAAGNGDMEATHQLGDLLLGRGDLSGAAERYMEAERQGYAPFARSAAAYFLLRNQREIAEVLLARAVDEGDEQAGRLLSDTRAAPQSVEDAEAYFADFCPLDATHHGVVLEKMGNLEEARTDYEHGYARGDAYGAYRLAVLLREQGDRAESALWYRKAADLGHPGARKALSEDPATVEE